MFNFLAHNGSCTLGKQPLLACLFGRGGSLWIWPGFQMTTHTREMRGWGGREGGRAKEGIGRKTQFILSNWLHLSKHSLLAQWSSQSKTVPTAKTKYIPSCVQLQIKREWTGHFSSWCTSSTIIHFYHSGTEPSRRYMDLYFSETFTNITALWVKLAGHRRYYPR